MKETVSVRELEKRMRPGAYSSAGFLGPAESLNDIISRDENALQEVGVTNEKLAGELEKLISATLEQRQRLLRANYPEYRQREFHGINWHTGPQPLFSSENLPSIEIGYLVENKYQVLFVQYRGLQDCPWGCKLTNHWSSFDLLLLNRESGEYVAAPGLIVHLIREHHFFEGIQSPYRVDPIKLVRVLGLAR